MAGREDSDRRVFPACRLLLAVALVLACMAMGEPCVGAAEPDGALKKESESREALEFSGEDRQRERSRPAFQQSARLRGNADVELGGDRALGIAARPAGLAPIDWAILVAYVSALIGIGWHYSRVEKSAGEYFVGNAHMRPAIVGISLFTSLLSTITYLSYPGEMIGKGPLILAGVLGMPLAYLVVGYLLIPRYMQHRVTSAYELLEARLGLSVRLLGAALYVMLRLMWMSVVTYIGAGALVTILGFPDAWTLPMVVVIGLITITYTSLGGLKAVVIADLMQSTLLLGGALLVIGTVTWSLGGLSWFPTSWRPGWDVQPAFSTDPTIRVTLLGSIVFSAFWNICTAGSDQLSVQRFMATRDARSARLAYGVSLLAAAIVLTLLSIVGFSLMGFFDVYPSLLPEGFELRENADRVFPRYISGHLPRGVVGLLVAALLAAQMSGLDSGLNSITAVIWTDWVDRLGVRFASDRRRAWAMRAMAAAIGLFVLTASTLVGRVESNFLELIQRTANLLTPAIFALFVFALFVPFANAPGVFIGAALGVSTAVLIGFSKNIFDYPISFQWIGISSLAVNLSTGMAASWILSRFSRTAIA